MRPSLDAAEAFAIRLGWSVRRPKEDAVAIALLPDVDLVVQALDGDDVALGLTGGAWHAHPPVMLEGPDGAFLSLDLGALLVGLARGTVVVAEQRAGEALVDRWVTPSGGDESEGVVFRVATPAG